MQNAKCEVPNAKWSCGGAKPILPTCREGDHSWMKFVLFSVITGEKQAYKAKLERNGGRYPCRKAKGKE